MLLADFTLFVYVKFQYVNKQLMHLQHDLTWTSGMMHMAGSQTPSQHKHPEARRFSWQLAADVTKVWSVLRDAGHGWKVLHHDLRVSCGKVIAVVQGRFVNELPARSSADFYVKLLLFWMATVQNNFYGKKNTHCMFNSVCVESTTRQ